MLKHIVICVTFFNTIDAILKQPLECLENSVKLDADFLACCRGKPTFTSENCANELENSNFTLSPECMVDCMYKDFKFYNGSNIDMTGVKTFLEQNLNQKDVKDMFIKAFDTCYNMDNSKVENYASIEESDDCDISSFYMDQCVWYHTLSHCPERLTGGDKEKCQTKSNWVKQCFFQ